MATYLKGEIRFISESKDRAIIKESACKSGTYSLAAASAVQGTAGTAGHQSLVSGATAISGSSVPHISAGTYALKVKADTGVVTSYNIVLTAGLTWTQIASVINTALTSVADVAISGANLVITSKTVGVTSAIAIIDGAVSGFIASVNDIAVASTSKLVFVKGSFSNKVKGSIVKYVYAPSADGNNFVTLV